MTADSSLHVVRDILRDRAATIALVGASNARHKYGNIILRDLRGRGYNVVPVNRHEAAVDGIPAVSGVGQLKPPVDIINVVVPPNSALDVVAEADPELCGIIWFQPGAFDDRVVAAARARFSTVLAGDCIMVVARQV